MLATRLLLCSVFCAPITDPATWLPELRTAVADGSTMADEACGACAFKPDEKVIVEKLLLGERLSGLQVALGTAASSSSPC